MCWHKQNNRGNNSHFPFTVLSPTVTNNKTTHCFYYSWDSLTKRTRCYQLLGASQCFNR